MKPLSLRDTQIDDLAFYMGRDRWMNLSDPGVGKTPSVCVFIEYLFSRLGEKSLWCMPKSLLLKNKSEILKFTKLTEDQVIIVDGTPKQRQKQMETATGVVWLMGFTRYGADWHTLLDLHPTINCTLVDEIHMGFKGAKSKRTESLFASMRKIKRFGAMSGTLIDGALDTCYPTIHIIEPRYYASHFAFKMQHSIQDEYGNVLTWTNHEKLGRIFLTHGIRRTFEQEYGKEEPIIQTDWVSMHPKQQKAYDDMEEEALVELDRYIESLQNDIIVAESQGVATIRCRQIMAHPEKFGILKNKEMTGKDEHLLVHLEDHKRTGKPLLIYSVLQPEQERLLKLCREQGFVTEMINGNVSSKKRNEIDEGFKSGKIDIVVASPETVAVGYNWGHLDHIIFASIDYKDSNFSQGYKRAIRGKREKPLRVTVLAYDCETEKRIFTVVNLKSYHRNKVDSTYAVLQIGEDN